MSTRMTMGSHLRFRVSNARLGMDIGPQRLSL
jgi:hypothetical protein